MTVLPVSDAAAVHPLATKPSRRRRRGGDQAGPVAYALLVGTAFLFLAPFYYMIVAASRPMSEMNQFPPPLTPGNGLWRNIASAWETQPLGLAIWNSVGVSSVITVTTVLLCTLSGFAFAKQRFAGKKTLFTITVGTMMIPPTLGIVPLYQVMAALDLTGKLSAVVLPSLVTAFGVFFMRQYLIQTLPDELLEAARVDGAGEGRIFLRVVLRLLAPGFVTVLLFQLVATWNNYFLPLIMLNSSDLYPLTVGLAQWQATSQSGSGAQALFSTVITGSLVSIIPLVVAFLFLQRYWQSGLTAGGVKQ
jgi:cellobiose transport system permease protein